MVAICSILCQSIRMEILKKDEGNKDGEKGKKGRKIEGIRVYIYTCTYILVFICIFRYT